MPSRVVDVLWNEFTLLTEEYQVFCNDVYGKWLHHESFSAMESDNVNLSLDDAWQYSCEQEKINPVIPDRLPLLFRLDGELNIPDCCDYSVEQGIYPKPRLDIAVEVLRQGVLERYLKLETDAQRQAANAIVAPAIRQYLLNDEYCECQGSTALGPVFGTILQYEGLATAVFGSMELAYKRQKQAQQFPDPIIESGGGCVGCCGG